jgi:alanine dehydrogenase
MFPAQVTGLSDASALEHVVEDSDLIIGGILVSGRKTPILITRQMVQAMQPGSVIIDVAVDQGGCVETIRPTKLDHPTYVKFGVIHCGVANLPSLVARTSTRALTSVTLPYILKMITLGIEGALGDDPSLKKGLVEQSA